MRFSGVVRFDGQGVEARDSGAQRLFHASQPGLPGARGRRVHLGDEISSEGVILHRHDSGRIADDLRYQVEVLHARQILSDRAEVVVR